MNKNKNQLINEHNKLIETTFANYPEAREFIFAFSNYCHSIDDIIDGVKKDKISIIQVFETAATIYSHPFYIKNVLALYPAVRIITNMYMDSVSLENDTEVWRKNLSKVLSHALNEFIVLCADVCGGFTLRRAISLPLREQSYKYQEVKE